jgi:hypothetical protein
MKSITEILDDLQVIVLEKPYETLNDDFGRQMFAGVMALKIRGYLAIHNEGAMPVDTTDFIATHLIVTRKNDPINNVLMAYKSTSYLDCEKFKLAFPFTQLLKNAGHPNCSLEMDRILAECAAKKEDLSYDTGWTICPSVREDKELQGVLKEMLTMFVVNHHKDYNIPHWVTLGILKVKTDQYFLKMGLDEISDQPILSHPLLHLTDARAVIAKDNIYSLFTHSTAKKYKSMWDDRITIESSKKNQKIAA